MAATNAARALREPADVVPARQRSWAETVPYDILDAGDFAAPLIPPARARRAPPDATPRLYAAAGGRRDGLTYQATLPAGPAAIHRDAAVRQPARAPAAQPTASLGPTLRMAGYGLGAALAAVVLYAVASSLVSWTQLKIDDMTYGNPRTTHLDAVVGHNDSVDQPTHFLAINLHRQISIIELPGGDIGKAVAIAGPYLFGDGEDLTPVQLRTQDLNGDGKPDLLVGVKNEVLVYLNDKGGFRPITAAEQATLESAGITGPSTGK